MRIAAAAMAMLTINSC